MKCLNRIFVLVFAIISIGFEAQAHDSDKAFFLVYQTNNTTVVEAEFPWTIRNSLLENAPYLNNASGQEAFDKAFRELIEQNLIVYGSDGEKMPFVSLEEIKDELHSHSYKYKLTYKGFGVSKIQNTLLFNIFDDSINYHQFVTEKDTLNFETIRTNSIIYL